MSPWWHFKMSMGFFFLALIRLRSTGSTHRSHGSVIAWFFSSHCLFPPSVATANHVPPFNPFLFYFYIPTSSSNFQLQHPIHSRPLHLHQTSQSALVGLFFPEHLPQTDVLILDPSSILVTAKENLNVSAASSDHCLSTTGVTTVLQNIFLKLCYVHMSDYHTFLHCLHYCLVY